jgi:ankyrin repeat protein
MDGIFTLSGSSREEIVSRVLEESDDFVVKQYKQALELLDTHLLSDSSNHVSEFLRNWASDWAIMSALNYDVMFSLFEIAHLEKGPEFMRRAILCDYKEDGLFSTYGLDLFAHEFYVPLTRYFTELGLERELWFTDSSMGLPLQMICNGICHQASSIDPLLVVPAHLINELLLTADSTGYTPLHILSPKSANVRVTDSNLSYRQVFEYLSRFENYSKAFGMIDFRGRTALHEIVDVTTDYSTLEFVLQNDACKETVTVKDKDGETPYEIFLSRKEIYDRNDTLGIGQKVTGLFKLIADSTFVKHCKR